jgi:lysozyme
VADSAAGLDVSDFSGQFSWTATRGLSFGMFRLTQGLGGSGMNSPDPMAAWNHQRITAKGLHRGAYHFLDPRLPGPAQAEYFVKAYDELGMGLDDMLWMDTETGSAGPAAVAACGLGFMTELEHLAPRNPKGVYSYWSFIAGGNCAGLQQWPLWLAWDSLTAPASPPWPWSKWQFWQWGDRDGQDADTFNGTPAQLDAWIGSWHPGPPLTYPEVPRVTGGMWGLARFCSDTVRAPVATVLAATLAHSGGVFAPDLAGYLNRGDLDLVMPAGITLWHPAGAA